MKLVKIDDYYVNPDQVVYLSSLSKDSDIYKKGARTLIHYLGHDGVVDMGEYNLVCSSTISSVLQIDTVAKKLVGN